MRPPFRIALFDSGGGGFSILRCLLEKGIRGEFSYFADDALLPYGRLTDEQIVNRVVGQYSSVFAQVEPDLLVVACNTASTLVLPGLRRILEFPVVGVVPAIKPAAESSKSRRIALLATPATVTRSYIDDLVTRFAQDCQVQRVSAGNLVEEAEQYLSSGELNEANLDKLLSGIFLRDPLLDRIVLGCTHFPLLTGQLRESLIRLGREEAQLVDSGPAVASRVAFLLGLHGAEEQDCQSRTLSHIHLYFTGTRQDASLWERKCLRACGSIADEKLFVQAFHSPIESEMAIVQSVGKD